MRTQMDGIGPVFGRAATLLATAVVAWVGLAASASAGMIGVNIQGLVPHGGALASGTSAGVVPQANWNNTGPNASDGSNISLLDDLGGTTTAKLSFSSVGPWYTSSATPATGDQQLMQGLIYGGNTDKPTVTITNIPYSQYDVYVYSLGAQTGTSAYITLGSTSYYFTSPNGAGAGYVNGVVGPFTFTQATSTTSGSPTANADYVKFSNVTGSSFTVNSTYVSGGNGNVAINGVQLVQVPEPGTLALLAFGSLAVLHRRKNGLGKK